MKTKYPRMFGILAVLLLIAVSFSVLATSDTGSLYTETPVAWNSGTDTINDMTMVGAVATNAFVVPVNLFSDLQPSKASSVEALTATLDNHTINAVGLAGATSPVSGDSTIAGFMLTSAATPTLLPGATLIAGVQNNTADTTVNAVASAALSIDRFNTRPGLQAQAFAANLNDLELTANNTGYFSGRMMYLSAITQGGVSNWHFFAASDNVSNNMVDITVAVGAQNYAEYVVNACTTIPCSSIYSATMLMPKPGMLFANFCGGCAIYARA